MDIDRTLISTAVKLCKLLDKEADALLPEKVAKVVKDHSKMAVASAWIPVPGADVAAGAITIWTMYGRINSKIGVSIGDNILKSIASGVATNLAGYAAMSGVASAMKLIPGIGTVGGAVIMTASLYAITLASGYVYLQALCKLAEKGNGNISFGNLPEAIDDVLANSSLIKNFIKEAKKTYKK